MFSLNIFQWYDLFFVEVEANSTFTYEEKNDLGF